MIWCFWEENLSWRLNYLTRYQDKRSGLPGKPWGGSLYPPQTSPWWQNFSWYSRKVIFFGFLFFSWIRRFHTQSYLPQLPRETLWMWWIRPLLLFIPPTSIDIVTENCVFLQDWMKRTLPADWWFGLATLHLSLCAAKNWYILHILSSEKKCENKHFTNHCWSWIELLVVDEVLLGAYPCCLW